MKDKISSSKFSSFKIVLFYAMISAVYIYTSDYFLKIFIADIQLLSRIQTLKGLGFILITASFLYLLVKKNIDKTASHYQQIIDVKQLSDNQLIKSQEEYMSLFNNSPLPMWLIDTETLQYLLVNEVACSKYGYSQEEYLTMTLKDILPTEDIPMLEKLFSVTLKSECFILPSIVRHRKKNEEIIHMKVKSSNVTFEGKLVRLVSAIDVTAEMDIQNKLVETNSKLQLASEIAGLGYWTNDLVKSEIQWSDEIYKIFEVDPQIFKLTLNAINERFHPDDQSYFDPKVYANFEDTTIKEIENRIITDSGKVKWILERIYLIKDKDGKPIKLEGVLLDITKIKLHEQEIWENNERFKILAKATVEAIMDWDLKNDTVMWGEGFHTMFGYDLSSNNKHLWSSNIHPDDREKILENLNKTLEDPTKEYFNAEFRFLKANRDIAYVQYNGTFIRDANGKVTRVLAAMIDLTESLERIRKIELQSKALKDISWTQSHVVRAPLANLLGLTTLLKENINLGVKDGEIVKHIGDSAEKLDNIIRGIIEKITEIDNV